jgi:hypothetical protein
MNFSQMFIRPEITLIIKIIMLMNNAYKALDTVYTFNALRVRVQYFKDVVLLLLATFTTINIA